MRTVLLVSLLAIPAAAEYLAREWEYRRPIAVESANQVYRARLDANAVRHMRSDASDLRIDRNGAEIPYVARPLIGSTRVVELHPEILNKGYVEGAGTQLTLDTGRAGGKHSRLRIWSTDTNYRRRVRIETSADGKQWIVVRRDGYVLDFEHDSRHIMALEVDYPVSNQRYVRATFEGWEKPERLTQAALSLRESVPAELVTVAALTPNAPQISKGVATYSFDLGDGPPPFDRVRVQAAGNEYHRAAELQASDDGKTWRFVAQGFLSRLNGEVILTLHGSGMTRTRYLRLQVFNLDDKPIEVSQVRLEAPSWEVKFLPREPGQYLLCYGNAQASHSSYDLPAVLARRDPGGEIDVTLGAEERNPSYQPRLQPVAWTDRHPALLYTVLVAAVLGLGYFTVRFFLKLRETGTA